MNTNWFISHSFLYIELKINYRSRKKLSIRIIYAHSIHERSISRGVKLYTRIVYKRNCVYCKNNLIFLAAGLTSPTMPRPIPVCNSYNQRKFAVSSYLQFWTKQDCSRQITNLNYDVAPTKRSKGGTSFLKFQKIHNQCKKRLHFALYLCLYMYLHSLEKM